MKLNKIDEVWNSANLLFCDVFGLLSSKNLATIATWSNDKHTTLCEALEKDNGCQTREKANRCQPREIDSGWQALRRKKVTGAKRGKKVTVAKRGNWSLQVQITGNRNRMPSAVDRLWVNNGYQAREKDDRFTRREKDKGYQAREIHTRCQKKKTAELQHLPLKDFSRPTLTWWISSSPED